MLLALAIALTLAIWPKKPVQNAQKANQDTIHQNETKRYESYKNNAYDIVDDSLDAIYQRERAKRRP